MLNFDLSSLLARSYRHPHRRFSLKSDDGVDLSGLHIDQAGGDLAVIYAHGFLSGKDYRCVPGFVEHVSQRFDVMAFDFRGHGESGGSCSFGDGEVADLATVVAHARSLGYRKVVTIGSSMGGATAIRHAATHGEIDGVVTIGAFSQSRPLRRPMTDLALRLAFDTEVGGAWVCATRGTRLGERCQGQPQPIDLVAEVMPPLLLIHGQWDPLIGSDDALDLYAAAPEPKDLVLVPRGGHDQPLLNDDTVTQVVDWISRRVLLEG